MPTLDSVRASLEGLYEHANRWALWIAAGVLGGVAAAMGYAAFKHAIATYPDFVVGYITLQGNGKAGEYAAAFGFLIGIVAAFHAFAFAMKRLSRQADSIAAGIFYNRVIIAVTPAILWATTSLWPQNDRIGFYWAAVVLVSLTLLGGLLTIQRPHLWLRTEQAWLTSVLEAAVLFPVGCAVAVHGIAMIGNRVGTYLGAPLFTSPDTFYACVIATPIVGAAIVSIIALQTSTPERATAIFRTLLACVQIPALGLLLVFLPLPHFTESVGAHYATPIRASNWVLFGILAVVGVVDIARLWRNGARFAAQPAVIISAVTLIAVLAYTRTAVPPPLPVPVDDYHAGETLVPWWSMVKHGMVPLWDFSPVRGLVNYEAGALAALFTDGTAAGILSTKQLHTLLLLLLVFPALALALGKWTAFLVLSFATLDDGPGGIDTIMAALLALLCWAWLHVSRIKWLVIWFAAGVAAVLIAPGQGGVLVLATIPAGLWQFYQAVRADQRQVLRAGAVIVAVTALLLLATPLGWLVAGAVRYGAGQSSVNGIANGIPWQFGSQSNINAWIFEVLRFSWLGVGAIATVLTLKAWASNPGGRLERSAAIFAGSTVALLCIIFITRSVVRLDLGFVGRPGWASVWALTLLLPIVIRYAVPQRAQLAAVIASVAAGSALTANFSHVGLETARYQPFLMHHLSAITQNATHGADIGLPNLGTVVLEKTHAARLQTVKAQLDRLLTADETFLDVTNNGAQYFYFNRPPPSESTAVYNLITSAQQLRTVETVAAKNVPVALIGPHTVAIDGLNANLRTYLVYRHLLLNYAPVTVDGFDYMIRNDQVERPVQAFGVEVLKGMDALALLERTFPLSDIGNLGRSMGRSSDQLAERARVVHDLDVSKATVVGAERGADGSLRAAGETVSVTFDLSTLSLAGKDAGILQFDLACDEKSLKWLTHVTWQAVDPAFGQGLLKFSGRNGTHVVPLDAAPRWLLAPALTQVTLTLANPVYCNALRLRDVKLLQRLDSDAVDNLAKREKR